MLPKLRYNLTNWVDGMKITRQHFIDSENALLDQLRDASALAAHPLSYGLLEPLPGEKSSLDCEVIAGQPGKFKVIVRHCRALTAGGVRIEIIPGMHPELSGDMDAAAAGAGGGAGTVPYLAVIICDPYNRGPFGHAAPDEYPPRNESAVSTCRLALVAEDEIHTASGSAYMLPVARFLLKGGELHRDDSYVPACAVIAAHAGTKALYNTVSERLNAIQEHSTEIVRKVVEGAQTTALALNTKKLCAESIWHISSEFFFFRTVYRRQSPVYMANSVVKLANIVSVSISLMPLKEKEELLQYFSHWNEISPGKFEEALASVTGADYSQEDIAGSFQPLLAFLKIWAELLEKLKDLKLIGARREGFDFGGRTMDTPKEKGKGKFSIFD